MRILITGAKGQLGNDLAKVLDKHQLFLADLDNCDITSRKAVNEVFIEFMPNVVIHGAAYTGVDKAETDRNTCYKINVLGTKNIVDACERINAKLVYISTDYVFDGKTKKPYTEIDKTNPINYYGQTKFLGEQQVIKKLDRYFIIRTAWLHGISGNNFLKKIISKAKLGEKPTIVDNQIGCPTFTYDLAKAIARLIQTDDYGIWHIVNSGNSSWYEFAKTALEYADIKAKISPIKSSDLNLPAKRARYSVLDNTKFSNKFYKPRSWQEALVEFIKQLE